MRREGDAVFRALFRRRDADARSSLMSWRILTASRRAAQLESSYFPNLGGFAIIVRVRMARRGFECWLEGNYETGLGCRV